MNELAFRLATGVLAAVFCGTIMVVFDIPVKTVWMALLFTVCVVPAALIVGMISAMRKGAEEKKEEDK